MGKSLVLAVKIIGDATSAIDSMDKTAARSEKLQQAWKRTVAASALVVGGLAAMGKVIEGAGEAANTSRSRIENIATSMGYFGDETSDVTERLVDLANKMALETAIDPNSIKQAQATLMTFKDIGVTADEMGGVFDRATQASADLAGAGFGTIESASVMLGKALGDPTRGLTALNRVGVQFTDTERDQIKALQEAGDMLGAQEIILQGVEKQVGGTAAATADASEQQKIAWQLAREEIGLKLLPMFEKMREYGIEMAGWVADNSELVIGLAGAIGALAAGVLVINGAMKVFAAIQALQTAAQWANNAAWLASPITWIVIAVIAAIALLVTSVVLIVKHWDRLKDTGVAAFRAVVDWAKKLIDWVGGKLTGPIDGIKKAFESMRDGAVAVFQNIIDWVQSVMDWVGSLAQSVVPGWAQDLFGMRSFSASMSVTPEVQPFALPEATVMQRMAAPLAAPAAAPQMSQYAPVALAAPTKVTMLTKAAPKQRAPSYEDKREQHFHFPNYTGDKTELLSWIKRALRDGDSREEGVIFA
ncbi:MAG: hypothetical protein ACTJGT_01750 [Microbacteriaceae bacterium]